MKEKILSFFGRLNFPSRLKIRYILRTFSLKEKIVFLILIMVFAAAGLGLFKKIDYIVSVEKPKSGGTLTEGIIGTPRFINPLLAVSDADRDLVNFVYSGLMRADAKGDLIPDLADRYEISQDGLSYTFYLKPNLEWPDKKPITSDDIIFTIQEAKNPVLKSSQRASWEGVDVEKIDDTTVKFSLKKPYAPFLENTTLGILPKHIWGDVTPEQISLSDFNINPLGSGPYKVDKISRNSSGINTAYNLVPNTKFVLQTPYISNIILKFYPSEKKIIAGYENGEIDSIGGISPQNISKIRGEKSYLKTLLLPRVFAVFFNQNNAIALSKYEVRRALDLATDKEKIIKEALQDFGSITNNPLPPGTIGALANNDGGDSLSYEERVDKAIQTLTKAGWKLNDAEKVLEKRVNKKETLKLQFDLATSNVPELSKTAELLRVMWERIGAKVNLKIFEIGDLNQNVIRPRKYDALLFGIMTGRDPDPFAFWHSSQRNDPGLNVALYANITADKILEETRTISDIPKREEKYQAFEEQIKKDIPAIFLYSPYYIYMIPKKLEGFETETITIPSERFSQVYKWHIEKERVWKKIW